MLLADTGVWRAELAGSKTAGVELESRYIRIQGKGAGQRYVRFGPVTANSGSDALRIHAKNDRLLSLDP